MLFRNKLERAQQWLKGTGSEAEKDLPPMDALKRESQEPPMEKGDLHIMILTALITIVPVCLLILLLLCGFVFFL